MKRTDLTSHLFTDGSYVLAPAIARRCVEQDSNCICYLRGTNFRRSSSDAIKANKEYYKVIPEKNQGGYLEPAFWVRSPRLSKGYLAYFCGLFFPCLSIRSILSLVRRSKHIVIHGNALNIATIFLMRLLGAKVVYIHWGRAPHIGRFKGVLDRFSYQLYSWVFCLMSPELRYFRPFMRRRVSVLPYPWDKASFVDIDFSSYANRFSSKSIILGNSAWSRDIYCKVLDRLKPSDWDKITCMLCYGRETEVDENKKFIAKYTEKFGARFFAWNKPLPYDEYVELMRNSAFYICPSKSQTGLGAIATCVRQGKAIILAGDNYEWLHELGVQVVDLDALEDFSFARLKTLVPDDNLAMKNYMALRDAYEKKYTSSYWGFQIAQAFDGVL